MLRTSRSSLLLFFMAFFAAIYRAVLVMHEGFPPGSDIGLHNSLIHSITQGGSTNFMWNYYHMGGGNSITFPGYHIFVSYIILLTGLPDYLAQASVAILFSSLTVIVAFLITRKVWNESAALIVAFLVAVSAFDIDMLLWSGYPNIVTLMLIPLAFYLLLEKPRFPRLPLIVVVSLVSAAVFLTHSLSTFMFTTIILATVFTTLCFPSRVGIGRRTVLEWLVPIFVGGLVVSPFLVQVAPIYLNPNSAIFTGGLPEIQQALLPIRHVPLDLVLPFFVCFFLYFVFSKYVHEKIIRFPTILLVLWLIIPAALSQSFIVGLYTDYQRFLYFAVLPLIISVGTGIWLGARLLAKSTSWLLSVGKRLLQKRFSESKILRCISSPPSNKTTVTLFATALILIAFLALPNFFMTPPDGFLLQGHFQAMNKPGYDAIQWIKKYTPTNSIFVADAWYGWWLGGFAQRPTISAVEPQFLANSREFEPALLASRLLDTDYLIDNGLIQIREDGGYISRHNPQILAKLNNSYNPYPALNFSSSETKISLWRNGNLVSVRLSDIPLREMHMENSSTYATIYVAWGNELLNYTQEYTVYQGVRFINVTQTLSRNDPTANFSTLSLSAQTQSYLISDNTSSIELLDHYFPVESQLIFSGDRPTATQTAENLTILCDLKNQSKVTVNYYVGTFEYPYYGENAQTYNGRQKILTDNMQTYSLKVAENPLDIFNYHQAIAHLNASYIVIRDYSQISKFAKDPTFNQLFINKKVAIFQIRSIQLIPKN